MINRELIRIKVVQMLYSYLLIDNPFMLESQPSSPTKEKRFAYSLYLDMLELMSRLADEVGNRNINYLEKTRFAKNIKADEKIKSLKKRNEADAKKPFANAEAELVQKIKESGIYKHFVKAVQNQEVTDEKVWSDLFNQIIMTDPLVNQEIASRENYTLKGVDRMRKMIDITFANFFASADHLPDALKVLEKSLGKARELYIKLLLLPIAITDLREREIDDARHKFLQTAEDLNPNMRFVENEFVGALRANEELERYAKEPEMAWNADDNDIIRKLLSRIMESELYKNYMDFPATNFEEDCELWKGIFRNIIFVDNDFMEYLEDKSVYWNDDIDIIGTFVLKTIKRFQQAGDRWRYDEKLLLPKYKDTEDARFGAELFGDVIKNKEYYRSLINENVNVALWETDRLAFMDLVIIMTALAEITSFPKIPLTVSFNEYIEIAKFYSTPKSGLFINGLLGKIVESLQQSGKLHKKF